MNLDIIRESFAVPTTFDLGQAITQSIALVILSTILSAVYYYTSNSVSNRSRLASTFPITALTTMLIISIIRSSLALSLGLVGALSIVRFRSAIKDPEELVYIFLTIAMGLGFGANQAALTTAFFTIIIVVMLIQAALRGRLGKVFSDRDSLHVEMVFSKAQSLPTITKILDKHCREVRLTRLEENKQQVIMFLVKPKSAEALESLRLDSMALDDKAKLTFLQYQPLV